MSADRCRFTGLYLFVLPYATKRRGQRTARQT
jgi:hypothetical protein